MSDKDIKSLGAFVWSVAELLRGGFKQSEYGKVILPFVVLCRLDCILAPTKDAVLDIAKTLPEDMDEIARNQILYATSGEGISPTIPAGSLSRAWASSRPATSTAT